MAEAAAVAAGEAAAVVDGAAEAAARPRARRGRPSPFSEPEIVGVIQGIDADSGRLTIAYEPVEVMNWPAGTQPFMLSKLAMLKGLTVGEKVRFTLESQEIAAIRPFEEPPGR